MPLNALVIHFPPPHRFEAHCWNGWDGDYRRWRDCFSDEHYLSTLLAHSGASEETVPSMSGVAAVDWSRGGPHPYSYLPDDIQPALVKDKLRTGEGCGNEGHDRLQAAAWRTFVAADEVDADSAVCEVAREEQKAEGGFEPLAPVCSLTARKFGEDTTQLVLITLMLDCDEDGVRLTRPDVCTAMRTELSDGGDGWFGWRW
jgi:hypothetical protein